MSVEADTQLLQCPHGYIQKGPGDPQPPQKVTGLEGRIPGFLSQLCLSWVTLGSPLQISGSPCPPLLHGGFYGLLNSDGMTFLTLEQKLC